MIITVGRIFRRETVVNYNKQIVLAPEFKGYNK